MTCPICSHADSRVIESRGQGTRRRECGRCRHRWTTVEVPAARKAALEAVERAVRAAAGVTNMQHRDLRFAGDQRCEGARDERMMTVDEARLRTRNFETELRAAIVGYEEATGLVVEQVCIDRMRSTVGAPVLVSVSVDVRLPRPEY